MSRDRLSASFGQRRDHLDTRVSRAPTLSSRGRRKPLKRHHHTHYLMSAETWVLRLCNNYSCFFGQQRTTIKALKIRPLGTKASITWLHQSCGRGKAPNSRASAGHTNFLDDYKERPIAMEKHGCTHASRSVSIAGAISVNFICKFSHLT
ncbi:unnamed protein product, partial [Ectocarpus sp. 12 AP-2014]